MTTVGLYSDSDLLGGAERSLLNLAAAYRGGAHLVVCSTHRALLDAAESIDGVDTHLIESRTSPWGAVVDHRRAFRRLGLDLVQITLANPFASRPALLAARLAGVPVIAVEQLVLPSRRRRGKALARLSGLMHSMTVAVGEASADDVERWVGIPRRKVRVVHNGVPDPGMGDRPAAEPGHPAIIGCAARLETQKGIDVLLTAMSDLPDVQLRLIGDGSLRETLEQQADALDVADRVDFLGWVGDAPKRIAELDVFVLPSRDEAFPLTIVEAMLAGTPVVATDVGSVREAVIDGVTGLLVPSGDPAALVVAVRRLLDDADLRSRLATAARRLAADRFTDRAMADGYERVWAEVLAR